MKKLVIMDLSVFIFNGYIEDILVHILIQNIGEPKINKKL